MSSVESPPSRARIALWIAAAVVLLTASVLVLVFGGDSGGQAAAPTSTLSREQELAKLRAEAVEAARTYFPRQDAAEAAGDPSQLDGIFVPGSELQSALAQQINEFRARGEVQETQSRMEQVEVVKLDASKAQVRLVNIITSSVTKDLATDKVKERFRTGKGTWRLYLARIGDRWLVEGLGSEGRTGKDGSG